MSRDAVLGLRGGTVVFANGAACERFGSCVGLPGESLLPPYVFSQEGDNFACMAPQRGEALTVCGARQDGLLLLSIPRGEEPLPAIPAGVLAELRQTAYNLRMASELMAESGSRKAKSQAYSAILRRNYYAMTRLLRNLSDVDALSRGELWLHREGTDLQRLYGNLVDSVTHFTGDSGVTVRFHCAPGCYCLMADGERLETLLLNLLANALKYTPRGGEIRVSLSRQGEHIILAVDDTGRGIAPARLATLFALRGSSIADADSAGLGLLLAQGIARGHGGALIIQSDVGRGTRVRVMLPAQENLPLRDDSGEAPGAGRILLELAPVLDAQFYDTRYND